MTSLLEKKDSVVRHHILMYHKLHIDPNLKTHRNLEVRAGAYTYEHGQWFSPPEKARPDGFERMRSGECYCNCYYHAVRYSPDLYTYCEGFAYHPNTALPIWHAWLLDREDNVIDPTWKWADYRSEYVGIPMNSEAVEAVAIDKGTYGVLDHPGIWDGRYPIDYLRRGV